MYKTCLGESSEGLVAALTGEAAAAAAAGALAGRSGVALAFGTAFGDFSTSLTTLAIFAAGRVLAADAFDKAEAAAVLAGVVLEAEAAAAPFDLAAALVLATGDLTSSDLAFSAMAA